MKPGAPCFSPETTAAGLNKMDFPALRKNPFLVKKTLSTEPSRIEGFEKTLPQMSSNISATKNLTLTLSPTKPSKMHMTIGKSHGVTSCFTADTIERLLEETPSFAISGEYNNSHCRSRYSTQGPKPPESIRVLQNQISSAEKLEFLDKHSRKSSIKKVKSNLSREKSVSKGGGGRDGSALRSNITGASPKRPALKVFHDFMKDI